MGADFQSPPIHAFQPKVNNSVLIVNPTLFEVEVKHFFSSMWYLLNSCYQAITRSPFHRPQLCAGGVPTGPTAELVTHPAERSH